MSAPDKKAGRIVYGTRPVDEVCRARPRDVAVVFVADGVRSREMDQVLATAKDRRIPVEFRPRALVADLAGRQAVHQGVVAVVGPYPYARYEDIFAKAGSDPLLIVILDGVTDPQNLGAIVRSAEVLGAHGVVVPAKGAAKISSGAVKASAGATERMPIVEVVNLMKSMDKLRESGVSVLGAAAGNGVPLGQANLTGPVAWVLGSEGRGIREAVARRCSGLVTIPQRGLVDSLNVSAAGAILLYETARQRAR